LYYVGLFLLDDAGEWVVQKAGTGEAGQAMLARGYFGTLLTLNPHVMTNRDWAWGVVALAIITAIQIASRIM